MSKEDNNKKENVFNKDNDKATLNNFISSILKNIKTMHSDFSKFVDDNFYDLI
jgi:uncharacterized protein YpmS